MAQIAKQKYDNFPNPALSTDPVKSPQWNCPCQIFHAVPATFSRFNNIMNFLPHSQATFDAIQITLIKNVPSGITILNPLWNCPWLSGEVLQCPGFFHLCMHLLQVLVFLVIIRSLQHSKATFGTKFKKKYLKKPVLDTVPVDLP